MGDACKWDILQLITSQIFKDCNELAISNMAQVQAAINILVSNNIPFVLQFTEGSRGIAAFITLLIQITPTTTISKIFQLEEGLIRL